MHTSSVLTAPDFTYTRTSADGEVVPAGFAALFADYHELDRVGVVSPSLEDGILFTGAALLALATAFYDVQRLRGGTYFNYPQHFALLGGEGEALCTRRGLVGRPEALLGKSWGNLDVWPSTNWKVVPPTAFGMLQQVFSLQINRLFWPENLLPERDGPRLPTYARPLLRARLKSVFLYGATVPNVGVQASPRAMEILPKSVDALPGEAPPHPRYALNSFREIPTGEFLTAMAACFAGEAGDPA